MGPTSTFLQALRGRSPGESGRAGTAPSPPPPAGGGDASDIGSSVSPGGPAYQWVLLVDVTLLAARTAGSKQTVFFYNRGVIVSRPNHSYRLTLIRCSSVECMKPDPDGGLCGEMRRLSGIVCRGRVLWQRGVTRELADGVGRWPAVSGLQRENAGAY